jgi:hypothetical protein
MTKTVGVTFFFNIKPLSDSTSTVRDVDFYMKNGRPTLSTKSKLIIFCDSVTQPKLKELRDELCPGLNPDDTIYIIRDFTDYDLYKQNHNIIAENRKKSRGYKDPNDRNTPSYYLLMIFKFFAIKIAKDTITDPDVTHFAWIDFGCSHVVDRAAEFIPKMLENPHPKLACTYIHYRPHRMIENMESYLEYFNPCSIAAGIWTIEKDLINLFYTRTMSIFYEELSKGVGHSDEGILVYLYDRYPEMFTLTYGDYYSLLTNYHNVIRDYNSIKHYFLLETLRCGRIDLAKECVVQILRSAREGHIILPGNEMEFLFSIR